MRKIILAVATLVFIAPAYAGVSDQYACMRDGPGSRACEWAHFQDEQQNERNRETMERAREAQYCMFHPRNCY